MDIERRKAIRVKVPLLAQYSKDNLTWDISPIKDLSELGIKIITRTQFQPGDKLRLRLRIPLRPMEYLEFYGKVVMCTESSTQTHITRIEFLNLSEDYKSLLKSYISIFLKK